MPTLLMRMHHAEVPVRRVIPSGYVSTDEAIHEMINADREWCRLSDAWEQAGRPMDARYHEFGARQMVLTDALRDAVAAREIPALAMMTTGDGRWAEAELPRAYWSEIVGDLALSRGLVVGQGLAEADRKRFEDAALCFRRVDWQRWLARTGPPVGGGMVSTSDKAQAAAVALTAELSRRVISGEDRGRDPMLGWLVGEFPELSKPDRANLYKGMPAALRRKKRGRPPGS